jgi:hypothetical protein
MEAGVEQDQGEKKMSNTTVFISYAHADNVSTDPDQRWLERMKKHLAPLGFANIIEVATDQDLALGDDWHARIQADLQRAHAAVLLISPDFLASKYIRNNELPLLLRQAKEDGLKIIPVLLSPCLFVEARIKFPDPQHGPEEFSLASLQAAGSPENTLDEMSKAEQNRALLGVAQRLLAYAKERHIPSRPNRSAKQPFPIELNHIPKGATTLFGRRDELAQLNAAWDSPHTCIVEVIAPGGVGKTALLRDWLQGFSATNRRGAERIYGWSFYSQGTDDKRQASEDDFLAAALTWFEVAIDPSTNPWNKGQALADAIAARRTLLVLDGLEPLQYPPNSTLAGELRAPGVKALLEHLLTLGAPGLCVLTSRERLTDLQGYERHAQRQHGAVERISLEQLNKVAGAQLLHSLGADHAGEASIDDDDQELQDASAAIQGHALTLTLLGRYLKLAHHGDIRRRDQVDFQEADNETLNGHAFRMVAAYETWLASAGKEGVRQLEALRLLGFFDRPASAKCLTILRATPTIPGLTKEVVGLSSKLWNITLSRLEEGGLLLPGSTDGSVDAHPLIREYLAHSLRKQQSAAWQEGHRRLYEYLKTNAVPYQPDDIKGLEPLYQAVGHGCQAGLYEEALDEVYLPRILRGALFYSNHKLGAYATNLRAIAAFFIETWSQPNPSLHKSTQAWLFNEAAFSLRALGQLEEAHAPMRYGAEMHVQLENWTLSASSYSNLCELESTLGQAADAITDGQLGLTYAEQSKNNYQRVMSRTTLAEVWQQQGESAKAEELFKAAEEIQAEWEPEYPLLYSVRGFRYCELLLAEAEQAAWAATPPRNTARLLHQIAEVAARSQKMFAWRLPTDALLTIALDHLTLGRCALYASRLKHRPPSDAIKDIEAAVDYLRTAGEQDDLPRGLLTLAWLRHLQNDPAGARVNLAEVERIATRGGMKRHLADHYLTRARLFFRDDLAQARADLKQARALIEEYGYGRRLPELADAEAMIGLA